MRAAQSMLGGRHEIQEEVNVQEKEAEAEGTISQFGPQGDFLSTVVHATEFFVLTFNLKWSFYHQFL